MLVLILLLLSLNVISILAFVILWFSTIVQLENNLQTTSRNQMNFVWVGPKRALAESSPPIGSMRFSRILARITCATTT